MASSPTSQSLDAFQTQIESKLRQTYSSLELPKSLHQVSSTTTPKSFIQNLQKCFSRMTKPIQLRCLIGLLGFEPNVATLYNDDEFDNTLREFLESLEKGKEDKWVTVIAGIIHGKLFRKESEGSDNSQRDDRLESGRNKKTDAIIRKAAEGIINSLTEASFNADDFRNEANAALTTTEPTEEEEKEMEILLDSFHIGTDVKPDFVPWCYRLCSGKIIKEAIPELDERCDFIVDEEADILKVDERMDRKKADDERKEEELKLKNKALAEERQKKMSAAANTAKARMGGIRDLSSVKRRGVAGSSGARSGARPMPSDTAALMMRTKAKGRVNPTSTGVGLSGRLGSNSVGGKPRRAGLGRGAAADAIGGKSLANPMSRMRNLGAKRGLLNSTRPGGGQGSGSSMNAGRARNRTKMKVIDVTEVKGLKKEEEERKQRISAEEAREAKKRKIIEKGKAAVKAGLKKKKLESAKPNGEAFDTTANENNLNIQTDPNGMAANTDHGHMNENGTNQQIHPLDRNEMPLFADLTSSPNGTTVQQQQGSALNIFDMPHQMQSHHPQQPLFADDLMMQQQPQQHQHFNSAQHPALPMNTQQGNHRTQNFDQYENLQQPAQTQPQQPALQSNQWQRLLERSNKLAAEDRTRVEQFFTTVPRFNPTPHLSVYKTKLNEDRTIDPHTQQAIKETLYLEMNYETGQCRISKRIKRK